MNISIRTVKGTALVVISGALVGSRESIDAIQRVERKLTERPETQVVLNLAAVPQINSTGLGMLIALAQKTVRQGGQVAVSSPHPQIASVFAVGAWDAFVVVDRDEDAFRALGS